MIIKNMYGELVNCHFTTLKNIDLFGYNFHRYYFERIEIEDTVIKKCDFRNAEMKELNIKKTKIIDSILIMLDIENTIIKNCDLSGQYLAFSSFTNIDFSGTDFNKVLMKKNVFIDCNFNDAKLNCAEISDCEFVRCTCNKNTSWNKECSKSFCGIKKYD